MPDDPVPTPADLQLRPAVPGDAAALHALSLDAIDQSAAEHYGPRQRAAWAGRRTVAQHRRMVEQTTTVVVTAGDVVAGFVSIALRATGDLAAGEVDQLFVHPDHGARGAARLLLQAAEDAALAAGLTSLVTHASWRAVPVFERSGYVRVEVEHVPVGDEVLTRVRMRKSLGR